MRIGRRELLCLLAILGVGAGLRFSSLSADPSPDLGVQFASDEGWWVRNARSRVLFDRWIMDDFNQGLFVAPAYCVPTALVFHLLGVGFASARLVSAVSGSLLPLVAWWVLARGRRGREGLLAAAALAACYPLVCLSRTALVEVTLLLFLTAAWALWATRRGGLGAFLAGIFFGLALLTKSYALFMAPILLTITGLDFWERKGRGTRRELLHLALLGAGTLLLMGAYAAWVVAPHRREFQVMYDLWFGANLPQGPLQSIRNMSGAVAQVVQGEARLRRIWILALPLLAGGWLSLAAWVTGGAGGEPRESRNLRRASLAWLLWAGLTVLPLTIHPLRRYVILLPPLAILAALGAGRSTSVELAGLFRSGAGPSPRWRSALGGILLVLPLVVYLPAPLTNLVGPRVTAALAHVRFGARPGVQLESVLLAAILLVAAAGGLGWWLLRRPAARLKWRIPYGPRVLLALVLLLGLSRGAWLLTHPTYSLRDLSRRLGTERFTPGTVVFGGLADSLCLETQAFATAYWGRHEHGRILNEHPIERFAPDYLVVTTRMEFPWPVDERYRVLLRRENYLESLEVCPGREGPRIEADLYSLEGVEDQEVVSTGPTVLL